MQAYVEPTVMPSPAGYALYGWMLQPRYETSSLVLCDARLLPDPLEVEP